MVLLPYVTGSPGGASYGLLELGVIGGLVLAAAVKWGLRSGWRRMAAPRGKHRPAGTAVMARHAQRARAQ